jgi:hypothetical protein
MMATGGLRPAAAAVIGFMSARSPEESAHVVEAFRCGLKDTGGGKQRSHFMLPGAGEDLCEVRK